jgi:hypothetical protein
MTGVVREGVGYVGQFGDGGGDVADAGAKVEAGGRGWDVAGEGLGDGVAGDASDGVDGRLAQHVGTDRGAVGPGQAGSGPVEDRVVPPPRDRRPGPSAEHRVVGVAGAACAGVAGDESQ